jgi:hypothetical protein
VVQDDGRSRRRASVDIPWRARQEATEAVMKRYLLLTALLALGFAIAASAQTPGTGSPGTGQGPNWVDANGNGICDLYEARGGTGQAGQGKRYGKGTGQGPGQGVGRPRDGYGPGSANCTGTGPGQGQGQGQGGARRRGRG